MPKPTKPAKNRIADIINAKGISIDEVIWINYTGEGRKRTVHRVTLKDEAYATIGTNPHEWQMFVRNEKQPDLNQATHIARMLGVDLKELNSKPKKVAA